MKLVRSMTEIIENTNTIDKYLEDPGLRDYAISLIKKGICFVVVDNKGELCFYPSRFIGYSHNSQVAHNDNHEKDGRETNPAISQIVGHKPEVSEELEREYQKYCAKLGFTATKAGAYGVARKFWKLESTDAQRS